MYNCKHRNIENLKAFEIIQTKVSEFNTNYSKKAMMISGKSDIMTTFKLVNMYCILCYYQ